MSLKVFFKDGEVDVFKQLLSQEVYRYYTEHNAFPTGPLVSYKMDGDIIFDYVEVTIGKCMVVMFMLFITTLQAPHHDKQD